MAQKDGWWVFGTVLAWVLAIVLFILGILKIIGLESSIEMFKVWGLSDFRIVVGVIEIVLAILFVIPATSVIGGYLLSAYFGGAIVTHLSHGQGALAFVPFLLLLIVWVVMFMRKPGVFSD